MTYEAKMRAVGHDSFSHSVAYGIASEADAEISRLRIALADAIRRPMRVMPDSAVGLVTVEELEEAEERRVRNSPAGGKE